jgi:hypothetical protein
MRFLLPLIPLVTVFLSLLSGCETEGMPCGGDPCDDEDACTVDICDPADGSCEHMPVECDDEDPCTTDTCDPEDGQCRYVPDACDDDDACTVDTCDSADGSCEYVPVECDDDNSCTMNRCDSVDGTCQYPPVPNTPRMECDYGDLPGLCLNGECVGACDVPDPCRELDCYVAVCDPTDGRCDYTPAEEGTPCGEQGAGRCCPGQICWAPGLVCPDVP